MRRDSRVVAVDLYYINKHKMQNITRIVDLRWVLLVAERWLLAWLLRDTTIVILRVLLLLLLHVCSIRRGLLHILSTWWLLLTDTKGRGGAVRLDAGWKLLIEATISIGCGLRLESLRGWVLSEISQTLNQVILLKLTWYLEVIDAILNYLWCGYMDLLLEEFSQIIRELSVELICLM